MTDVPSVKPLTFREYVAKADALLDSLVQFQTIPRHHRRTLRAVSDLREAAQSLLRSNPTTARVADRPTNEVIQRVCEGRGNQQEGRLVSDYLRDLECEFRRQLSEAIGLENENADPVHSRQLLGAASGSVTSETHPSSDDRLRVQNDSGETTLPMDGESPDPR